MWWHNLSKWLHVMWFSLVRLELFKPWLSRNWPSGIRHFPSQKSKIITPPRLQTSPITTTESAEQPNWWRLRNCEKMFVQRSVFALARRAPVRAVAKRSFSTSFVRCTYQSRPFALKEASLDGHECDEMSNWAKKLSFGTGRVVRAVTNSLNYDSRSQVEMGSSTWRISRKDGFLRRSVKTPSWT